MPEPTLNICPIFQSIEQPKSLSLSDILGEQEEDFKHIKFVVSPISKAKAQKMEFFYLREQVRLNRMPTIKEQQEQQQQQEQQEKDSSFVDSNLSVSSTTQKSQKHKFRLFSFKSISLFSSI